MAKRIPETFAPGSGSAVADALDPAIAKARELGAQGVEVDERCGEHAVVRGDKPDGTGVHRQGPSVSPHPRIHHYHMDSARGEIRDHRLQQIAGLEDILRRNLVRDIDYLHIVADRENDPLHRGHIRVGKSKVGRERDNGAGHGHRLPRMPLPHSLESRDHPSSKETV